MIKDDDKNEKYVLIDSETIVKVIGTIDKNDPLYKKLLHLFSDFNSCDEYGNYRLEKKSKLFNYIKNVEGVIYFKEYITLQTLSDSLTRSIYEYNHEMKKKLNKYFRSLMDAIVNGEEVDIVKNIISNDEKVMDYLKKFENFEEYIKDLIGKRLDFSTKQLYKPIEIKTTIKEKNKSHVIM